jgi:hypothetical protein
MGSSITLDELMEALLELGELRFEELLEILRSKRWREDSMVIAS